MTTNTNTATTDRCVYCGKGIFASELGWSDQTGSSLCGSKRQPLRRHDVVIIRF